MTTCPHLPRESVSGLCPQCLFEVALKSSGRLRALHARHDPQRSISDHGAHRARWDGRGLSRRRSQTRPAGGVEIRPARDRAERRAAAAALQRGAVRPAGCPSECLPAVRSRRLRRSSVHRDGVRRRRESRGAAAARRATAATESDRHRTRNLRRPGGLARSRSHSRRSQTGEHHDRWTRPRRASATSVCPRWLPT